MRPWSLAVWSAVCPLVCAAAMLVTVSATPALAQQGLLRDPVQIELCLCLETAVRTRSDEMQRRRSAFERLTAQIEAQRRSVEAERDSIDTTNDAAVTAFRIRVETIQEQEEELWQVVQPAFNQSVAIYSEREEMYRRECVGRPMDADVIARVRQRLQCTID
ncbi:MAG: hypothetical protein SF002_10595 [Alphaproteobacteria bacterium]|nr:hypothetical protein [Alphaproteobacteria bacterium]